MSIGSSHFPTKDQPPPPKRTRLASDIRIRAALSGVLVLVTLGAIFLVANAEMAPPRSRLVAADKQTPIPPGVTATASPTGTDTSAPPAPAADGAGSGSPALAAYKGLGAWVSLYDFALAPAELSPAQATAAMAAHGVQTLYLQTGRWNLPPGVEDPSATSQFIDDAHSHGMKVVGWYLPGFANIAQDIANSKAVLSFKTPSGQHFDGLALDIEDKSNFGYSVFGFDSAVSTFADKLRAAVGPNQVLGAITLDAVNNERAPSAWAGFPWPEIGKDFDVVLPMAYWSVTKPSSDCTSIQDDAGSYIRNVYSLTTSLMGRTKPMVIVGGVGDCDTLSEVQEYVAAAKSLGTLGASIYSYETVEKNPAGSKMWAALQSARS
ncbi:MAG: hypothetical protein ACRDJU_07445 [Actinomycetota bacterium]